MLKIDRQIDFASRIGKGKVKKKASLTTRLEAVREEDDARIPEKLSRQAYNPSWLAEVGGSMHKALGMKNFDVVNDDGTLINI
jgi:hypothetical protein